MPSKDNFYSTENIDELAAAIELSGIKQTVKVKPFLSICCHYALPRFPLFSCPNRSHFAISP